MRLGKIDGPLLGGSSEGGGGRATVEAVPFEVTSAASTIPDELDGAGDTSPTSVLAAVELADLGGMKDDLLPDEFKPNPDVALCLAPASSSS
jgi:hypothetical protein